MSRSKVSRADLARVIGLADDHSIQFVAAQLKITERAHETKLPRPAPPLPMVREEVPSDSHWPADQAPTPFWRPLTFRSRETEAGRRHREIESPDPDLVYNQWHNRPSEAPVAKPLATWSELVPRLRAGLTRQGRGARVDVKRLVQRVAKRQLVRQIPRKAMRRWGNSVVIAVDYSERLTPYRDDQHSVCRHLRRLIPENALRIATVSDPEDGLMLWSGPRVLHTPDPGSVVLVLGDLGTLDTRGSALERRWLAWGRFARDNGSHLVALTPCGEAEVAEPLRRVFSVHPWQKAIGGETTSQQQQRRLAELLRAVAPAVRLEPGLLRAIRGLRPQWSSAALESLVWQDDALRSQHPSAATLDEDAAKELLPQFERLDSRLRKEVLALIRVWHGQLEQSVWLDELRRLSGDSRALVPADDGRDALAQARYFKQRAEHPSHIDPGALSFLSRSVDRQSNAGWYDETIGPIYRALSKLTHPEIDAARRPNADPIEEPDGDTVQSVWLRQVGEFLGCRQRPADTDPEQGSPCATLSASNGLIAFEWGEKKDHDGGFWRQGITPPWATDWGHDEFGAWAEIQFRASERVDPAREEQIKQRLRWVPPGTFLMGSPADEVDRDEDEGPLHEVTFSRGFWLFDTTATQDLWQAVMDDNPSRFPGHRRPVENVSWDDCQNFMQRLASLVEQAKFQLPTEAQWEYACRAGTTTPFSFGENIKAEQVNYDGNYPYSQGKTGVYREETVEVGTLPPNRWGLYEMHGNVDEWCHDGLRDYTSQPMTDPFGPTEGVNRAVRGGSWLSDARIVRSAVRDAFVPVDRSLDLGFRCALVQEAGQPAEPEAWSKGREAEPRPGEKTRGGASRISARLAEQPGIRIATTPTVRLLTNRDELVVERFTNPSWASAIGRDKYGLWADFTIEPANKAQVESGLVTQRMRWVPPGRFIMGSDDPEDSRLHDAMPAHEVILSLGFWLFETPVTQELWIAVVSKNPSHFAGGRQPVDSVSYLDCLYFLQELGKKFKGLNWTLPSEAQWEYACRAGTETAYSLGDEISPDKASYDSSDGTVDVGTFSPNNWGLYDMHGNVWEWCQDGLRDYTAEPAIDPLGSTDEGVARAVRGGGWSVSARIVRSACRDAFGPAVRISLLGFRCALVQAESGSPPSERSAGGVATEEQPGRSD